MVKTQANVQKREGQELVCPFSHFEINRNSCFSDMVEEKMKIDYLEFRGIIMRDITVFPPFSQFSYSQIQVYFLRVQNCHKKSIPIDSVIINKEVWPLHTSFKQRNSVERKSCNKVLNADRTALFWKKIPQSTYVTYEKTSSYNMRVEMVKM